MKKSKVLSLLTAGAMCVAMLPMSAFAAGIDSPYVTSATIAGVQSVSDDNGNLYLTVPSNTQLAGQTFNLTTSEAVSFVGTSSANAGELYAVEGSDTSATLRFAIDLSSLPELDVNFDAPEYSITLTSTDGMSWNGSFASGFATNMSTLGQGLNYSDATLRAGIMENAEGDANSVWNIYTNSDAVNTQLVICDTASQMATVTYDYNGNVYIWTLPVGAPLPQIALPGNYAVEGWYSDAQYTNAIDFTTATVTGDMTVYAQLGTAVSGDFFLNDLADEDATVLRIGSPADFNDFVNHSTEVDPDQCVVLTTSIDLNNASYQAIQFEGNFDGQGNTISNARFTANGSYAGMFSELGENQKIVNLYLDNITVTGGIFSGYAGVLAGQIYGNAEGNRSDTIIQNVHVTNSSVTGYASGGLVGFAFVNTIRYCSVEGTSVSGMANGGGIAGLSYADIDACYTDDLTIFALQSRGRGGIAGKLLESGKITDCWYTYDQAYGEADRGTMTGEFRLDRSLSTNNQYTTAYAWADATPDVQPDWTVGLKDSMVVINFAVDTTFAFPQNS